MAQAVEKFLSAEENAERLVEVLTALQKEISSYQTATMELDQVREGLLQFVRTASQVAEGMNTAVELLRSIGGPEILAGLDELARKMDEGLLEGRQVVKEASAALEKQMVATLDELTRNLGIQLKESSDKTLAAMRQSRILIMVSVCLSAAAVVLSLVSILR